QPAGNPRSSRPARSTAIICDGSIVSTTSGSNPQPAPAGPCRRSASRSDGPYSAPAVPQTTDGRGARAAGAARAPGTYRSTTTWQLVPPKPNELTPATGGPPAGAGQGRGSAGRVSGPSASGRSSGTRWAGTRPRSSA